MNLNFAVFAVKRGWRHFQKQADISVMNQILLVAEHGFVIPVRILFAQLGFLRTMPQLGRKHVHSSASSEIDLQGETADSVSFYVRLSVSLSVSVLWSKHIKPILGFPFEFPPLWRNKGWELKKACAFEHCA